MTAITLPARRPVHLARLLFLGGLMAALVAVTAADVRRDCRRGPFSAGFGAGFESGHCKAKLAVNVLA